MDLDFLKSGELEGLDKIVQAMRYLGITHLEIKDFKVQLGPERPVAPAATPEDLVKVDEVTDDELLLDPMAGVKLSRPRRN